MEANDGWVIWQCIASLLRLEYVQAHMLEKTREDVWEEVIVGCTRWVFASVEMAICLPTDGR